MPGRSKPGGVGTAASDPALQSDSTTLTHVSTFPADVLAFAGMPTVMSERRGHPYRIWKDRHGGCFVFPEPRGRSDSGIVDSFAPAFPEFARATRYTRRIGEPERLFLRREEVESLAGTISEAAGNVAVAGLPGLRVAVPGAYRKITVAVQESGKRPTAFGKLAAHDGGEIRIRKEAEILTLLGEFQMLQDRVPRMHGLVDWNERDLLVVSPGPPGPGARDFNSAVRDFLERLHEATSVMQRFGDSVVLDRWSESLHALGDAGAKSELELIGEAVRRIEAALGSQDVPVGLSHGDFTRWNTRTGPDGLFVFDWETALIRAMPGNDAFHFNWSTGRPWSRRLRQSRAAVDWIADIWPASQRLADWLWLSYLVELGLQYGLARRAKPDEGDDRVLRSVVKEIAKQLGVDVPATNGYLNRNGKL